jgi:hypothetical protein
VTKAAGPESSVELGGGVEPEFVLVAAGVGAPPKPPETNCAKVSPIDGTLAEIAAMEAPKDCVFQ